MRRNKIIPDEPAALRSKAEERLRARTAEAPPAGGAELDTQRLLHELQVHQIELEMQNEELRRARDDAESLLTQYSYLYDFAPIAYITLDGEGNIRNMNFAGAALLGAERSQLIGINFYRFVKAESRPVLYAILANVVENQTKDSCEVLIQTADNPHIHARIEVVVPEFGNDYLIAIIDITKSKMVEKVLNDNRLLMQALNESLEQKVASDVEELRNMDKLLRTQSRQAAMGEMINCIAHQWRQPLNTLGMNIQRLSVFYELGGFDKNFLDQSVRDAMFLIKHMSQTIDDFRNFFLPDKEKVPFEVAQSVRAAIALVQESLKSNHIQLEMLAQGDHQITGYPSEYAQVLLNIVMNAQDILLEHKVEQPRIIVSSFVENGRAVVTIADNAGGVPEELQDRIFEPYFTTKGPDRGTGIGLFMAKTIIEKNMGGRLSVRNINGGAEFRIEV